MSDDYEVHVDERGALLPVELGALTFEARRVFVVTAPVEGATRGGHEVSCREQLVLVSGRAEVRYGAETIVLDRPGQTVLLEPGPGMEYDLAPGGTTLLVIADRPYTATRVAP